jgi:hypothetical protein
MAGIKVALRHVSRAIAILSIVGAAGCAGNNVNMASYFGGVPPKPKTVVVSELDVAPGTISVEHGLSPSYRRKLGKETPDQLKAELATALDEAVTETMIATLTDGGLPATVGQPDAVEGEPRIIVTGQIRKLDEKDRMKRKLSGLAPAHGSITADIKVNQQSAGAQKELLAFGDIDLASKAGSGPATTPVVTGSTDASEKLTASAAAEARRVGKASANRILAFAIEQGWISRESTNTQVQAHATQ